MRSLAPVFAAVVLLAFAASARAERRVALVIGEGAYEYADKLANPLTDARNMRDTLRRIGFAEADIVYGENLNKRDLERTIGRFATLARGADVALAFYAGHGATFGDTPYIVPIDARFDSMDQMPYELTPLENMIGELRKAKGVRIAIIDACRDNSAEKDLKRQDARGGEITRGLAPPKNPEGLILAYATQYLSTAADGPAGGDSPFTAALLKHLPTPGLDVKQLFFEVGAEVLRTTSGKQRPEVKVSFFDRYALVPGKEDAGEAKPAAVADMTAADFSAAKRLGTAAGWKEFLERHPIGPLAELAREELERLSRPQLAAVTPAAPAVSRPSGPCGEVTLASLATRSPAPLSATEECALAAKAEFQECESCPKMVVVPAGSFTMGSPKGEKGRYDDEGPQHDVTISRPFAVGKFEVSFEEWDACVADGGCGGYRPDDGGWGRGRLPVIFISWNDARAYASWLSRKTGKSYRLLSEAEWEYASRGGSNTPFWWGSAISTDRANYNGHYVHNGGSEGTFRGKTVAVDSFAPNVFGLYNVHGNVGEWVEDCYDESYVGAPADGSVWTTGDCFLRVRRGGSWGDDPRYLRAASRHSHFADAQAGVTGLRLARTLNH